MKIEPARVMIDLEDYQMGENHIVSDSGDYRSERQWKRRELSIDEMDEDYNCLSQFSNHTTPTAELL